MTDESPQKTEDQVEETEDEEVSASGDAAGDSVAVVEGEVEVAEETVEESEVKPSVKRVRRRTKQDPPLTAEELKAKVVGWGERVGTALVGFLTNLVDETTEKVENVADRIASDLEDEDEDGERKQ